MVGGESINSRGSGRTNPERLRQIGEARATLPTTRQLAAELGTSPDSVLAYLRGYRPKQLSRALTPEPFVLSVFSDARDLDSEYRRDSQLPGGEPQEGPQEGGGALGRAGKGELYRAFEPTLGDCERAAVVTDCAIDKPAMDELVPVKIDGHGGENMVFIKHRRMSQLWSHCKFSLKCLGLSKYRSAG